MSSVYVREQVKALLEAESNETVIDLTAMAEDFKQMLSEAEVQPDAPWLGLQFLGDDEIPIALAATNDKGKYREFGGIHFHVAGVAKLGAGNGLLTRGETLRNLFRGRRIGDIIIDSVTPMNFDSGATLQFEGGYMSGTFSASYRRDLDL